MEGCSFRIKNLYPLFNVMRGDKMEKKISRDKKSQDRRRVHYEVQTRRDTKMMKSFIDFKNRVEHPTVTPGLLLIGITFILLPVVRPEIKKDIGITGVAVSALLGAFLAFLGIARQYITIALMKRNPGIVLNEEIIYLFGNEDIRAKKEHSEERVGYYKNVYSLWEDEKTFYLGLENDELVILPKNGFKTGEAEAFKLFIIEKSNAKYIWTPTKWKNIYRARMVRRQMNKQPEKNE